MAGENIQFEEVKINCVQNFKKGVKSVNVLLELNAVTAQYKLARNSIKRISRIFYILTGRLLYK